MESELSLCNKKKRTVTKKQNGEQFGNRKKQLAKNFPK